LAATTSPNLTQLSPAGKIEREQWNLLSLRDFSQIAQAYDVQIEVKVSAKLKDAQTLEQLNVALKELGIADHFRKD